MFLGISVIRQFLALEHIRNEHDNVNLNLENSKFKNELFLAKMEAIGTLFSMGMFYVSFLIGAIYVNKGIYTISIMMASIQLINKIVTPLYDGVAILNKYNGAIAIVDKLENSLMVENRQSGLTFDKINKISIKNLCFKQQQFEMKNINIELENNKKYVIVGKSGSGKSTLLNLISGQMTCHNGELCINNVPYKNIDYNYLKKAIAYMNQEVYVFNDIFSLECTVLMVLHSFNEKILKKCDKIIVMNNGEINEVGSYEELTSKNSYFSELYNMR